MSGEIKTNTVEQMRSRSLRRLREVAAEAVKSTAGLVIMAVVVVGLLSTDGAFAGEQSGGRGGGKGMTACQVEPDWNDLGKGEQSGGRGGN